MIAPQIEEMAKTNENVVFLKVSKLAIFGRRSLGLFSPGAGGGWVRTLELRITSICSTREPLLSGEG
jgi:hypothetical protein